MPHGLSRFRSSLVPAAKVILELEDWLPRYTERNTSGQVAPQGWIAAVRAGWPDRVSFPSATTEIYLDVRCNPRTPPAEVRAQFEGVITEIRTRHPEIELDWDSDRIATRRFNGSPELDCPIRYSRLGAGGRQTASHATAHQRTDRYIHDPQSRHSNGPHGLGRHA